jgi:hypothetical protein
VKGDLWSNDTNLTSSADVMTINVEHVGEKEDLYANNTKECDNMYSNIELNEKISKYRIAVNDLALVVEMTKKSTDFNEEFSVRIVYYYIPLHLKANNKICLGSFRAHNLHSILLFVSYLV